MTRRQLIAAIVLAVAVGVIIWLRSGGDQTGARTASVDGQIPDYYLETFTLTAMTPAGQRHYRLDARRMEHFPHDQTSELEQPRMVFFRADGPPWHVDAKRGWVGPDAEHVLLLGAVDITRDDAAGYTPLHIETRDLHVYLEREYAETDQAVTARSPDTVTRAVGMRADLPRARVMLRSQVRTVHEPASD